MFTFPFPGYKTEQDLRRADISASIDLNQYTRDQIKELAVKHAVTTSAIMADIIILKYPFAPGLRRYATQLVKAIVKARDGSICQYCGKDVSDLTTNIIEHVVPVSEGGCGEPYNLVFACASCNILKKGGQVWIPLNWHVLNAENPEWAEKILNMATITYFERQYKKHHGKSS